MNYYWWQEKQMMQQGIKNQGCQASVVPRHIPVSGVSGLEYTQLATSLL